MSVEEFINETADFDFAFQVLALQPCLLLLSGAWRFLSTFRDIHRTFFRFYLSFRVFFAGEMINKFRRIPPLNNFSFSLFLWQKFAHRTEEPVDPGEFCGLVTSKPGQRRWRIKANLNTRNLQI